MDQVAKVLACILIVLGIGSYGVSFAQNEAAGSDLLALKVGSLELDDESVFDGLAKLSQTVPGGFAVERELTAKSSPVLPAIRRFKARIGNVSLREALDWLCALDPRYRWSSDGHTVNFFPRDVEHKEDYPLNRVLDPFKLRNAKSVWVAASQAAEHAIPPQQIAMLHLGSGDFEKPITIEFSRVTLREALNQIARKLGPTYGWQFSGTEDFHFMVFHEYLEPTPPRSPSSNTEGRQ